MLDAAHRHPVLARPRCTASCASRSPSATFVSWSTWWAGGARRPDLRPVGLGAARTTRPTSSCPSCSASATRAGARIIFYVDRRRVLRPHPAARWSAAARCSRPGCARALLTGVAELREQVADLTVDRATAQAQTAAAVSAEATALRRLERDIHDGPQQRLVRLAMDLGRAQQQLDTDPEAARATVDEALAPDPGDAGRAARALPRHRPADPGRPRAAGGAGRAGRPRHGPGRPGRRRRDRGRLDPAGRERPPTSWSPRR